MLVVSLAAGVLSLLLAAAAAARTGRDLIVRRYRRGRTVRRVLVAVYATLGLGLLGHALIPHPDTPHVAEAVIIAVLFALGLTIVALPCFRITTPTASTPRRILAIGAHPDDLEIACGASLARLVDSGHEVHALVMSHGAVGGDPTRRPGEALAGARFLGLASVTVHDLPDTNLALTENQMIGHIEDALRRIRPHIVLTHSDHDQHQDHHAVHLATLRDARNHHSILCFESPSTTRQFNPDVFLEVDDYTDIKVEAVLAHRDQSGKPYMTPGVLTSTTRFRGRQAKSTHAEAFEAVRLLVNETGVL